MLEPLPIIEIEDKKIGKDNPVYFIADIAANHDGDIERAKDLIYLAADAGADAAKFQHFQAETIVSDSGFKALGSQLSHQAKWGKSVFDVYKKASVDLEWTVTLWETCKKAGIPFFTTPYNLEVISYIDQYVPAYKIGSGDITWSKMVETVAKQNKPYFLACGASTLDEIVLAVDIALRHNPQFALMQCNTNYTANLENFKYINLNVIKTLRVMYPEMVLGLSDHTPGHSTVLGAIALGARVVEKHFTDDNARSGPDHEFSMNPQSWKEMVVRARELELALGSGIKTVEHNEKETVVLQRRSLRLTKKLQKGHVLDKSDLIALRPCPTDAVTPNDIEVVVGKTLSRPLLEGDYIRACDIE